MAMISLSMKLGGAGGGGAAAGTDGMFGAFEAEQGVDRRGEDPYVVGGPRNN